MPAATTRPLGTPIPRPTTRAATAHRRAPHATIATRMRASSTTSSGAAIPISLRVHCGAARPMHPPRRRRSSSAACSAPARHSRSACSRHTPASRQAASSAGCRRWCGASLRPSRLRWARSTAHAAQRSPRVTRRCVPPHSRKAVCSPTSGQTIFCISAWRARCSPTHASSTRADGRSITACRCGSYTSTTACPTPPTSSTSPTTSFSNGD